jgi:hypothetical protein
MTKTSIIAGTKAAFTAGFWIGTAQSAVMAYKFYYWLLTWQWWLFYKTYKKKHQRMYPLVPLLANHQGRQFGSGPKGSEMMQHELLLALGHCLLAHPESLPPQPVASRSSHSGEATGLRSSHSHGSMWDLRTRDAVEDPRWVVNQ